MMKKVDSQRWFISVVLSLVFILLLCGLCVYIIDPFFHYRKPYDGLIYGNNVAEQYVNDGIAQNFEYNAIIAGTSMVENFKTSEFDSLFEVESVKLSNSGASFKEVDYICKKALSKQQNLQVILRSLDLNRINVDKDAMRHDSYPEYLYNDNRLDDVNYLLDKYAFIEGCGVNVIEATILKREALNFDTYANWNSAARFGKEAVLSTYERLMKSENVSRLSEEERVVIKDNIEQNVIETAREHPNKHFILFFTPYSICYWDTLSQEGTLLKNIQMQQEVIELLLPYENIELYSFCNNFELVCNLDNYKDQGHYSEDVNSDILCWVAEGKYRITEDNYAAYLEEIADFYGNYDYDSIYE